MKTLSKILSVVLCLAVVMAMFVIGASAEATTETLLASSIDQANDTALPDQATTNVTIDFDKGTHASLGAKFFITSSTKNIRLYAGNTMTITVPEGKKITKIVTTSRGSGNDRDLVGTCTVGNFSTNSGVTTITISGANQAVTIVSTDKCQLVSIAVTYDDASAASCQHPTTKWEKVSYGAHREVCADAECGGIVTASADHDTAGTDGKCSKCGYKADLSNQAGIIAAIKDLADGETIKNVSLTGTIKDLGYYSAKYNSVTIDLTVDGLSGYLRAQYAKAKDGSNIDLFKLCAGDTITITGNLVKSSGYTNFEKNAIASNHTASGVTVPSDPAAVVDALYALESNKSLPYNYTLTGKVTSTEGGKIYITVAGKTDKPVECYGIADGAAKKADVKLGDTITVTGVLKNYKGAYEFNGCELNNIDAHTCQNSWKAEEGVGHYEECSICSTKSEPCDGTVSTTTYKTDATHHWNGCSVEGCKYILNKAEHSKGTDGRCTTCAYNMNCVHEFEPKKDATHHWSECKLCGDIEGGQKVAHTVKHDNNQHWIECSCGTTTEKAYHTLNNNKCDCGYEKVTEGYLKVTNGKLTSGKYVMVLTNGYAPTKMDGTWLLSGKPTIKGNQVTNPEEFVVTLTVDGNKVTIKDASGNVIINKADNNGLVANATEGTWTWEYKDGYFMFHDGKEEARYLASNAEQENKFRAYRLNSSQASSQTNTFVMYKLTTSGGNSSTGDNSVVSLAVAAAVLSVMGCAVLVSKKKHF